MYLSCFMISFFENGMYELFYLFFIDFQEFEGRIIHILFMEVSKELLL